MLMKCLFDINEVPNKVYDWNKRYAKEEEILLHNLTTYEKIGANKASISQYLYAFSEEEREKYLSTGSTPPSNQEIHQKIRTFVKSTCQTEAGRTRYEDFIKGKSTDLLIDWKVGKSLW